jgi:hypothetical protein
VPRGLENNLLKPGFTPLNRASFWNIAFFGTSRSGDGFAVAYNRLAIRDGRGAGWRKPRLTPQSQRRGFLFGNQPAVQGCAERGIPLSAAFIVSIDSSKPLALPPPGFFLEHHKT